MEIHPRKAVLALAALLLGFFSPLAAFAQPDQSGSTDIEEDEGGAPFCDQPCFIITKAFEVYLDGNPTGPGVCPAGNNTFLYTLTHTGGAGPLFVPGITLFELAVASAAVNVTSAGFIPGPGVDPSATTIDVGFDLVKWDFQAPPIPSGSSSDQLFVCSPLPPGTVNDNSISIDGQLSLDAPGTCVGPFEPPQACNLEIDKTCCIPSTPIPGIDVCQGKVRRLVLEYTGDDCSATNNDQEGAVKCSGDPVGGPADIVITKDANEVIASPATGIAVGSTFEITRFKGGQQQELKSATAFQVLGSGGTQSLEIHTSCSKALRCDDQFGSVRVVEIETTEGGTVTCTPPDPTATMCSAPGFPEGTPCDERPVEIIFEYNGQDCQDPLPNPQEGAAECTGDATGAVSVGVIYTGKDPAKITVSPASNVNDGDRVRLTATGRDELHSTSKLLITDGSGVRQSIELHTSCSKSLKLGDEFGSLKIVEFTEKNGAVKSLPDPGTPIFQEACDVPLAPPSPHCTSKVNELTLVYIGDFLGEGCNVSNPQGGAASCTGVDDPGEPVSVTITKDAGSVSASPDSGISMFDLVSIAKNDGSELGSSTEFDVSGPGGSQSLKIHTSCSKPLNLGDRFGSFAVFAIDRKDDGTVSLGGQVEYQYTVTNPNALAADNVTITDDPLGQIATGLTIPAGESIQVIQKATLFGTTTNTATVLGEVGGDACEVASDELTTTVLLPPAGAFDCSDAKPIDQLTMTWNGTQAIHVKAWDGDVGDTYPPLVYTQSGGSPIQPGESFTVSGMGGSPNDQVWEIFDAGLTMKLGESKFHISCSDDQMNGVEDCDRPQGDGKNNDPTLINDWLLEGISGAGGSLECTPGIVPPPSCGLGAELLFVMPGLIWLRNRRRRGARA